LLGSLRGAVSLIFLVDVTSSMGPVITALHDELEGLVMFVAITDAADDGLEPSRDRSWVDVRKSLRGRIVSTIDPGVLEDDTERVDPDLWPTATGGFGRDTKLVDLDTGAGRTVEGVSYSDLELLLLGHGLVDVPLAPVLASTCVLEIPAETPPTLVTVALSSAAGNSSFEIRAMQR
jgi:hypothetical protein